MQQAISRIKTLFKTGFFHIFGSNILNKGIAFLSSIVLVRILTKSEYGVFTYAWNIYSIVLIFNGMGIESGVLQLCSERSGEIDYANRVTNYSTRFGIKFNMILLLILVGIGVFAPLKIEGGRRLLVAVCLLPVFHLLFNLTSSYLRAQKRYREFAKIQVINTLLVFFASAVLAFILRDLGLVIGHYFAYFVTCLIGFQWYRVQLINRKNEGVGEDSKVLLKISLISMINNGLSQLLYLLDVFVLGIVDPQETILASYKVATMIPTALTFIPLALITYLYPFFAEHKDDGKWCLKTYKQILLGLGCFNLVIVVTLFSLAPLFVKLLFGEQYMDALPVFRILVVNYFFSGTFRILSGNLLVTQRKLKFNLFVAVISSLTNVVCDYFFIQWWGSIGAALATVMVVFVSSVLSTSYLIHIFRQKKLD